MINGSSHDRHAKIFTHAISKNNPTELFTVRRINVAYSNINLEISLQYRKVAVLAFIHALCLDLLRPNHSVSERHIYFNRAFVINHNATPRTTWFLWHMLFEKLRLTDNLNTECSFLLSIYGLHIQYML